MLKALARSMVVLFAGLPFLAVNVLWFCVCKCVGRGIPEPLFVRQLAWVDRRTRGLFQ